MNETEIREVVLRILGEIAPEADLQALATDQPVQEQLDIDSMDSLNFFVGLAEATGVEVPERDYPKLQTVDECVAYVAAHAPTP